MRIVSLTGVALGLLLASAPGFAPSPNTAAAASPATTYTLPPSGEGRRNFLKLNCYGCHGMNAAGGMAINIQHKESGDVGEAVRNGEDAGMPSFRSYFVSNTDVTNMAAYLASIGTASEPTWTHWWEPFPTQ